MKQFAWISLLVTALLSACGGGSVRSPDFIPTLQGIRITPKAATATLGNTFQFEAVGLYSTPPGAAVAQTTGPVSNVQWSVDNSNLASVDAAGLARGLRRGVVNVTAKSGVFQDSAQLTVSGRVLETLVITLQNSNVPAGRSTTASVRGIYSDTPSGQTEDVIETVNWKSGDSNRATVSPSSTSDSLDRVIVQTGQVGPVPITAEVTRNAEGDLKSASATLMVTAAVLEALQVSPSSASIPKGATQTYTVMGIYSNSPTPRSDVVEQVSWSAADTNIASVSPTTGLSTVATGLNVGNTQIIASATNSEGVTRTGSAGLVVNNAIPTALVEVLPANPTIPQDGTQPFSVTATFSDGSTNPVDSSNIDWTSGTTATATINASGVATGLAIGTSTITATLKAGVAPAATPRSKSTTLNVTGKYCRVPFLPTANVSAPSPGANCLSSTPGGCTITTPGNVVTSSITDAAEFRIAPAVADYDLVLNVAQAATDAPVIPVAGQLAGFIIGIPTGSAFNPSTDLTLTTLNGTTVQDTGLAQSRDLQMVVASYNQFVAYLPLTAGKTFNSLRASVHVNGATTPPTGPPNPVTLLNSLINNGGTVIIEGFQACSTASIPP